MVTDCWTLPHLSTPPRVLTVPPVLGVRAALAIVWSHGVSPEGGVLST